MLSVTAAVELALAPISDVTNSGAADLSAFGFVAGVAADLLPVNEVILQAALPLLLRTEVSA